MNFSEIDKKSSDRIWLFVLAAAVLFGVWIRFKGFGTWPLAVDEYYIYRSVSFILDSGMPAYPCGGYYTRGLGILFKTPAPPENTPNLIGRS